MRIPEEVAQATNEGVKELNARTAGIRARFRTDSPFIAIHVEWKGLFRLRHMPLSGSSSFDLYTVRNGKHFFVRSTLFADFDCEKGFDAICNVSGEMQDYILNFPLYQSVDRVFIGVKEGSLFETPAIYSNKLPVVFYGSSITQGGCASRSGNSYQNMLSRALDMDYINLGFAGSGKGEIAIAEYMAKLPMSVFVSDYDHNAPTEKHLEETHERLYKIIRKKNPDIPYVMISRPNYTENDWKRRSIVFETFSKAKAAGDENVYFIDGAGLFCGEYADSCTVDGCHPNDLGFYHMAQGMLPILKKLLY